MDHEEYKFGRSIFTRVFINDLCFAFFLFPFFSSVCVCDKPLYVYYKEEDIENIRIVLYWYTRRDRYMNIYN